MSHLTIKDLPENATLDQPALAGVRGGLSTVINNSQQANQNVVGGFGPIMAVNSPISAPSTVLTEANPTTLVNLNTFSLTGAAQNFIGVF